MTRTLRHLPSPLSLEGEGWGEGEKTIPTSYWIPPMPLWIPAFAGMTDLCKGLCSRERSDCKAACKPSSVSRPGIGTAAIHLGLTLPAGSSGQPGAGPDSLYPLFGLAPDGVCLAPNITAGTVSSYLAFSPLPAVAGGMSLWHFPSGRPAPPLAGILSGGARTFLSPHTRQGQRPPSRLATSL